MCLDDILSFVGMPWHRSHRNMMVCSIFKIAIGLIAGLALGMTITYCCEEKVKKGGGRKSQKSSSESDSSSGSDGNKQKKCDCIKQDIMSGCHDVKQGVENAIDKVSDLYSDTQD